MKDLVEPADPARVPRLASEDIGGIVARSNSSFQLGMRILPRGRRDAIHAVYAFCRVVDDVVDEPGEHAAKVAELDLWEQEIHRVATGRPPRTPLGAALGEARAAHDLPVEEFHRMLSGMRMDLSPLVAPSVEDLRRYVRCVAGSVGILSMHIFGGWQGEPSRRFALSLAEALQLTNILRDVEQDAELGRIYLPGEHLAAAGVAPDPARIGADPRLAEARRRLGLMARAGFHRAAREIPRHDRRRLLPALLMMGPYERLLSRMEADWTRPPPKRSRVMKAVDGLRCAVLGGAVA